VGLAEEWVVFEEDEPTTSEQIEELELLIAYLETHPDIEAGLLDSPGRSYLALLRHLVVRVSRMRGFSGA
jgi:hypothetical protein